MQLNWYALSAYQARRDQIFIIDRRLKFNMIECGAVIGALSTTPQIEFKLKESSNNFLLLILLSLFCIISEQTILLAIKIPAFGPHREMN